MEFSISRTKRPYEFNMENSHCHPYYELYYLLTGHCKIFINHTLYYVDPGDVVLIVPEQIHRSTYHSSPMSDRIAMYFTREYLQPVTEQCGEELTNRLFCNSKITVPSGQRSYIEELISRIEFENAGQDGYSALLKRDYCYELLVLLSRCQDGEAAHGKLEVAEKVIEEAAEYLYHHYAFPITLEEVAGRANMSPAYFSRKFKAVTGFGYKEYVTNIRIRHASDQLRDTDHSVTQIAQECGFGDANYFGDAFHKVKGVSPTQFRRLYRT